MSVSSAIPEQLLDYSNVTTGQDTALQKAATSLNQVIEAFNQSGRSPGIVGAVPYTGNTGVAYAARNSATDQWVGQVGQAFANVARSQLPPQIARQPDVQDSLLNSTVTTTDAKLAAEVGGDPVQLAAKQAAAASLAAKLDEALWTNDEAAIQAVLQQLAQHQNDPAFNSAFFKQLGPTDTLYMAYQLGNPNAPAGGLQIFDQALASATNSADWDPQFNRDLFAKVDGVVPYGAPYLLKYGVYSEDFLTTAADAVLNLGPDQRPDGYEQEVSWTLAALARNPQAALDYLTQPVPGSQSLAPRLSLLLTEYGQDLRSGADDPVVKALGDLLRAAGTSPDAGVTVADPSGGYAPEVQVLLQTLGEMPKGMVPSALGPSIADVISGHIDLFVPPDPTKQVSASWTWQDRVFQLAEEDSSGNINHNAVTEIEGAIMQWQLSHEPPAFNDQSTPNINGWLTYLQQAGVLWGLAALPVRQAPYDRAALEAARVTALSNIIGMIPFGNFVPAKYELTQFVVGEGAVLLNEVGTAAANNIGQGTPDQRAVTTEYQQMGAMNIALATQFLAAHMDELPKGADFNQWVTQVAEGKELPGAPADITQFKADLANADRAFLLGYNNPGRGGS